MGRAESRLEQAVPACTFPPGWPQQTVTLRCWTCQRAPHSASCEGSGAKGPRGQGARQSGQHGRQREPIVNDKMKLFLGERTPGLKTKSMCVIFR